MSSANRVTIARLNGATVPGVNGATMSGASGATLTAVASAPPRRVRPTSGGDRPASDRTSVRDAALGSRPEPDRAGADVGRYGTRAGRPVQRRSSRCTTSRCSIKPARIRSPSAVLALLKPALFIVWALAVIAVALARRRPRVAVAVALVLALTPLSAELLKPLLAHPHVSIGAVSVGPASWPSGHASAALALALCAVLVVPAPLAPAGRRRRRGLCGDRGLLPADPGVAHAERRARRLSGRGAVDRAGARGPASRRATLARARQRPDQESGAPSPGPVPARIPQ